MIERDITFTVHTTIRTDTLDEAWEQAASMIIFLRKVNPANYTDAFVESMREVEEA